MNKTTAAAAAKIKATKKKSATIDGKIANVLLFLRASVGEEAEVFVPAFGEPYWNIVESITSLHHFVRCFILFLSNPIDSDFVHCKHIRSTLLLAPLLTFAARLILGFLICSAQIIRNVLARKDCLFNSST